MSCSSYILVCIEVEDRATSLVTCMGTLQGTLWHMGGWDGR